MLHQPLPKIPSFETAFQVVARHADLVRPKAQLTVSQWAQRHLNHYDPDALPFLAEIMDACSDPQTSEVGDMGPAQGGKSMVGEAFTGWSIEHDPAPFMLGQPDKSLLESFIKLRINPMVTNTPALRNELAPVANADNMHIKLFRNMFLVGVWPVENQFRQRTVCRGWLDDYDGWPADIEGKGDGVGLLDGRMTVYKGRDTKLISSSPAREDGGGIEAFTNGGTDERLQPTCPSCGDRIELDLIRDLKFTEGSPEEAAQSAHVICPSNGCILEPEARHALIASTATLPNRGFVPTRPEAGRFRRTFRRDGLLSFTPWADLARQWRAAQLEWSTRQDESALKVFWNVKAGKNYRSILSGEKPLKTSDLAKRRDPTFALGTVPAGVKTIVIVVDAQATSFQCAAIGFGNKLESWLIDRWSIDVLEDGTPIRPFIDPKHADALLPLWRKTWPLADGSGDSPPALSVAIDTGGGGTKEDSWTSSARALWHKATAPSSRGGWAIERKRITLIKGGSNPRSTRLMPPAEFADKKVSGGAKRNSPDLWMPNVHRIKNIIDARLRISKRGAGYINLPGADRPGSRPRIAGEGEPGIDDDYLDEITAEEMKDGRWQKLRPRNETLDHLVYAYASILKPPFAQSRDHMRWVPAAYRVPDQVITLAPANDAPARIAVVRNQPVVALSAPGRIPKPKVAAAPQRKDWLPSKRPDWLNRRR